jgi:AraC family transcriptional activator of pobA
MKGIPTFVDINELHEATGSNLRSTNKSFHCFRMEELHMNVDQLPAYRSAFFTLALSFGSENFMININEKEHNDLKCYIICIGPGQISSFRKEGNWKGFCTFFTAEFATYKTEMNFLEDYPFFNINNTNIFPISEDQFKQIGVYYHQILHEQLHTGTYYLDIARATFQAILLQIKRIFENTGSKGFSDKAGIVIASKFQYLVNQHFVTKITVEQYAQLLHISPNHLTQTIKMMTGRTPKSIILQRRIEEAKYLLRYTSNDMSTIAYLLNFREPAHFNNLFKKMSGFTPLAFRKFYRSSDY